MKALLLKHFPDAQIIDIDHSIKQFSILSGAFVIEKIYKYFPERTIFICVVHPGVGSKREPIYLDLGNYKFIGPNNGLFHYLFKDPEVSFQSYKIKDGLRPKISTTFHGRDVFTPAAIEIAKGNLDIVEPIENDKLVNIPDLDSGALLVTCIDGFGNIKTNVPLEKSFNKSSFLGIKVRGITHKIKVATTLSEVAQGELLCYMGSNNTLEIAANLASAEDLLRVVVGDRISVEG